MVELADTPGREPGAFGCGGSTPPPCTTPSSKRKGTGKTMKGPDGQKPVPRPAVQGRVVGAVGETDGTVGWAQGCGCTGHVSQWGVQGSAFPERAPLPEP